MDTGNIMENQMDALIEQGHQLQKQIHESKEIVGNIIQWNLWLNGVIEKPKEMLDPNISLSRLIQANEDVKTWNKAQIKANPKGPITQHQTLADRLIAGVYVALNYSTNGEAACCINGIGVGCVKIKE